MNSYLNAVKIGSLKNHSKSNSGFISFRSSSALSSQQGDSEIHHSRDCEVSPSVSPSSRLLSPYSEKCGSDSADDSLNSGPVSNEKGESMQKDPPNDICRDFLRNVCRRGSHCKFKHPEKKLEQVARIGKIFCHDYINRSVCNRENCRYIHATRQEEQIWKNGGPLPDFLYEEARRKGLEPDLLGEKPICKDFLKNMCARGNKCKFSHAEKPEFDSEERSELMMPSTDEILRNVKRKRIEDHYNELEAAMTRRSMSNLGIVDDYGRNDVIPSRSNPVFLDATEVNAYEQEISILKRRLNEEMRRNDDLKAVNEYLSQENAQFRLGERVSQTRIAPATQNVQHQQLLINHQPASMVQVPSHSMVSVPVVAAAGQTVPSNALPAASVCAIGSIPNSIIVPASMQGSNMSFHPASAAAAYSSVSAAIGATRSSSSYYVTPQIPVSPTSVATSNRL